MDPTWVLLVLKIVRVPHCDLLFLNKWWLSVWITRLLMGLLLSLNKFDASLFYSRRSLLCSLDRVWVWVADRTLALGLLLVMVGAWSIFLLTLLSRQEWTFYKITDGRNESINRNRNNKNFFSNNSQLISDRYFFMNTRDRFFTLFSVIHRLLCWVLNISSVLSLEFDNGWILKPALWSPSISES